MLGQAPPAHPPCSPPYQATRRLWSASTSSSQKPTLTSSPPCLWARPRHRLLGRRCRLQPKPQPKAQPKAQLEAEDKTEGTGSANARTPTPSAKPKPAPTPAQPAQPLATSAAPTMGSFPTPAQKTPPPPPPPPPTRTPLPALQGNEFIVSMHLRHADPQDDGSEDERGELACLVYTLAGYGVLVADGEAARERERSLSAGVGMGGGSGHSQGSDGSSQSPGPWLLDAASAGHPAAAAALHRALAQSGAGAVGYKRKRPCVLLLASDRSATVTRVKAAVKGLGCSVRVADHGVLPSMSPTPAGGGAAATGGASGGAWAAAKLGQAAALKARGPWKDGLYSIADLELLQHADAFIGSTLGGYVPGNYSSMGAEGGGTGDHEFLSAFSMLVASLVATNGRAPQAWTGPPAAKPPYQHAEGWLGVGDVHRVRYLPTCGGSFGSYLSLTGSGGGAVDSGAARADIYGLPPNGYYAPGQCEFFYWDCGKFNATKISPQCVEKRPSGR